MFDKNEQTIITSIIDMAKDGNEPVSLQRIISVVIPEIQHIYFFDDDNLRRQVQELSTTTNTQETEHFNDYSKSARAFIECESLDEKLEESIRKRLLKLIDLIDDLAHNGCLRYYATTIPIRKLSSSRISEYNGFILFNSGNADIEPLLYRFYCGNFYITRKLRKLKSKSYKTDEEIKEKQNTWIKWLTLFVAVVSLITSIATCINETKKTTPDYSISVYLKDSEVPSRIPK